jgi:hypothetical protein
LDQPKKDLQDLSTPTLIADWLISTSTKRHSVLIGSCRQILRHIVSKQDQQVVFGVATTAQRTTAGTRNFSLKKERKKSRKRSKSLKL